MSSVSQNRKIAFLTMDSLERFVCDDDLVMPHLENLGISVEWVDWRRTADWNSFDLVIIRSTWNYQDHQDEFLSALKTIAASDTTLMNPLDVVLWNIDKKYLFDLQEKEIAIVPTIWFDEFQRSAVESAVDALSEDEFIIKPNVSANADNTFRLTKHQWEQDDIQAQLRETFAQRKFMVQPFVESILTAGELSLFYFDKAYSHAIIKRPKIGDFRVQEEHGGLIDAFEAPPDLIQLGSKILKKLNFDLLLARVDFADYQGQMRIMEIELIEPSLYFRFDENAAKRFAMAIDRQVNNESSFRKSN